MFPFPQFIGGTLSLVNVGAWSMGARFLYVRTLSFIIAGQVHKRQPFSKLMGPIMHIPLYMLLPFAIHSVLRSPDSTHRRFIAYTCCASSISLVLDVKVTIKHILGIDPGRYGNKPKKG